MMNRKGVLGLLAMAAMFEANDPTGAAQRFREEEERSKRPRPKLNPVKQAKNRGLKKFSYPNGDIWASSQKVADKKAKKRNLI